jgi:hypothetical protein
MLEDEPSQTRFEGERQAPVDALTTAAYELTRSTFRGTQHRRR